MVMGAITAVAPQCLTAIPPTLPCPFAGDHGSRGPAAGGRGAPPGAMVVWSWWWDACVAVGQRQIAGDLVSRSVCRLDCISRD